MFKVGDKVRYTGHNPSVNTERFIGYYAVVVDKPHCDDKKDWWIRIKWQDNPKCLSQVMTVALLNVELAGTHSPFEADLIAYIEREKRELGI